METFAPRSQGKVIQWDNTDYEQAEQITMSLKNLTQPSLADGLVHNHKHLQELDDIQSLIDWEEIARELKVIEVKDTGNSAYPATLMFKIILLQTWYNLSDVQMEKQMARDLMFRRFAQLPLDAPTPDHSTIWRFREKLAKLQLQDKLLANINVQLHRQRIKIKQGSVAIIDATLIRAHYGQDENASWASKTNSQGKVTSTHGYKSHINVDDDGFVNSVAFNTAAPHDSQVFEELLVEGNQAAYADSAFKSKQHDELLEARGIKNEIHAKGHRNNLLTEQQKHANRLRSSIRNTVERVFGQTKNHMGLGVAKYYGIARNALRSGLIYLVHNLKTARQFLAKPHHNSV